MAGRVTLSLLSWFATNKDAVIAMGALVSPVTAMVAAMVSYRAVVTGPRIQREIARSQFELTGKQLALQERAVALTEAQMSATLLGAAEQKWIEDLRGTIAELEGLITERGLIWDTQKQSSDPLFLINRAIEIGNRLDPLLAKIRLMVGPADDGELTRSIRKWITEQDSVARGVWDLQVFDLAWQIIEQKQAGITARLAAVNRAAKITETAS
jgi:hypothetical protein